MEDLFISGEGHLIPLNHELHGKINLELLCSGLPWIAMGAKKQQHKVKLVWTSLYMQRLFAKIGLIYQSRNCRKMELQEKVIHAMLFCFFWFGKHFWCRNRNIYIKKFLSSKTLIFSLGRLKINLAEIFRSLKKASIMEKRKTHHNF